MYGRSHPWTFQYASRQTRTWQTNRVMQNRKKHRYITRNWFRSKTHELKDIKQEDFLISKCITSKTSHQTGNGFHQQRYLNGNKKSTILHVLAKGKHFVITNQYKKKYRGTESTTKTVTTGKTTFVSSADCQTSYRDTNARQKTLNGTTARNQDTPPE